MEKWLHKNFNAKDVQYQKDINGNDTWRFRCHWKECLLIHWIKLAGSEVDYWSCQCEDKEIAKRIEDKIYEGVELL